MPTVIVFTFDIVASHLSLVICHLSFALVICYRAFVPRYLVCWLQFHLLGEVLTMCRMTNDK